MLRHLLESNARKCPDEVAVVAPDGSTTWAELLSAAEASEAALEATARLRVGVYLPAGPQWLAALAALDSLAADVFLLDDQLTVEACRELAGRLQLAGVVTPSGLLTPAAGETADWPASDGGEAAEGEGSVTILTSGTTGRPKAARHTWPGLARPARASTPAAATQPQAASGRWLLTYRPNLYAGLQVVLQCLATQSTLVVPPAGANPAELAELMAHPGVTHISATPSWWRRLLLLAPRDLLGQARLVQITLGGEAVEETLLTSLAELFPGTRLTHIYATTELGRCFSVTDGREGFPARFLEAVSPDGVEMTIDDGELCVRSANAMLAYDRRGELPAENAAVDPRRGWFRTGDLVEERGERVYFVGRRSEMINVGGNKVQPLEVERVLRQVPGVADLRVFGQRSSIAGQLVACEVVAAEGASQEELRQRILEVGRSELRPHQRPRILNFVETIRLTSAGKTARQEGSPEGA